MGKEGVLIQHPENHNAINIETCEIQVKECTSTGVAFQE